MDKHLKKFFKVKDGEEEKWDKLLSKIAEAEKIEDKKEGAQAFINIMKKMRPFGKMRRFTIRSLRKYKENNKNSK